MRLGKGGGGVNNPFPPPQMMRGLPSALHSAVCLLPLSHKVPKAPIRSEPNEAKPSHGVRLRPQTHPPPASTTNTTTTTPPSPSPTAALWQWSHSQPQCALTEPSV